MDTLYYLKDQKKPKPLRKTVMRIPVTLDSVRRLTKLMDDPYTDVGKDYDDIEDFISLIIDVGLQTAEAVALSDKCPKCEYYFNMWKDHWKCRCKDVTGKNPCRFKLKR